MSMSDKIFKKIEITGTSNDGIEQAIDNAVGKAAETIHNLRWFEVEEVRGAIEGDKVSQWQVTVKIGFALD
jgi:flavin-binding protein dodecin